MNESQTASPDGVLDAVRGAVLGTDGVARLEPSFATLDPARLIGSRAADGIRISYRDGAAVVIVAIATTGSRPARAVTHDVRTAIAGVLAAHRLALSAAVINVLAIDT